MKIKIKNAKDGTASMLLDGDLTIYTVNEIKNDLAATMESSSKIDIDLSGISHIDTAGFQLLIAAKKTAEKKQLPVEIIKYSTEARNIFNLYGELTPED